MHHHCFTFLIFFVASFVGCSSKVDVDVYYGSQCYDSRNFIVRELAPNYNVIKDHINLNMVSYGKTFTRKTKDSYSFFCQLGPSECVTNKVHACAQDILKNMDDHIKFISCFMKGSSSLQTEGPLCAKSVGASWSDIESCATSSEGDKLLSAAGEVQIRAAPDLHFVPWIVVDGERSKQAMRNIRRAVCRKIKENKPTFCN